MLKPNDFPKRYAQFKTIAHLSRIIVSRISKFASRGKDFIFFLITKIMHNSVTCSALVEISWSFYSAQQKLQNCSVWPKIFGQWKTISRVVFQKIWKESAWSEDTKHTFLKQLPILSLCFPDEEDPAWTWSILFIKWFKMQHKTMTDFRLALYPKEVLAVCPTSLTMSLAINRI